MSGPSFSNIDLWLFELEEGNLSPTQIQQLELFLLQHPEYDVDKDVWEMAKVQPKEMIFPNQDVLLKKREFGWFYVASIASIFLLFFSFDSSFFSSFSEQNLQAKKYSQTTLMRKMIDKEIHEIQKGKGNSLTSSAFKTKQVNTNNRPIQPKIKSLFSSENALNTGKSVSKNNTDKPVQAEVFEKVNPILAMNEEETVYFESLDQISNNGSEVDRIIVGEESLTMLKDISSLTAEVYKKQSVRTSKSFQKKMRSFARKIERMANNPVALKNYRDPDFHIPGLLINDVNFSSTGTMLANRFQALSRIQWLGRENEQFMNQIAFDGYSNVMKGGIGIQLNHTTYADGGINVSNVAIAYSPKLSLTKTVTFEPSIRFKMGKKVLNYQRMESVNEVELSRQNMQSFYSSGQTPNGQNLWYKDLGVGLMMNTEWFFVSAQVDNLFRHRDNIYENDTRRSNFYYSFSAGTDWVSQDKKMSFSPYVVYQNNEHLSEGWLGANYRLNWFTIGAGVSTLLDPTASIGVKFKHFSFQYTTDYLSSDMMQKRAISHQVTLRIVGKSNRFGKRTLNL